MSKEMYRLGRIAVYLGIFCIITGLLIGFSVLLFDMDNMAINWLSLVPLGFILLLTGTVTRMLFDAKPHPQQDKEPD